MRGRLWTSCSANLQLLGMLMLQQQNSLRRIVQQDQPLRGHTQAREWIERVQPKPFQKPGPRPHIHPRGRGPLA
jgi:hypothetical protein